MHKHDNSSMPTSITIRDVPDQTRDELAARAAATGRSLQEYLRAQLVDLASRPDVETVLARIRERKQRTGTRLPAAKILAHRDADRR
jgi:plasmid stability protein